jgi:hypothetical protein
VPSATAAAGAVGPAYTGTLVSLALQGEGIRPCMRGGAWSSKFLCVSGSMTNHWVMESRAMWQLQECWAVSCYSYSLFADSERALLLTG